MAEIRDDKGGRDLQKIMRYRETGMRFLMLTDLRDMFFCIGERNESDSVWLFLGSLQHLLPVSVN